MRRVAATERAERRRQIWTLLERASERGEPPWAIIQFPFVASLGGTGGRVFERVSLLVSGLLLICRTDIIGEGCVISRPAMRAGHPTVLSSE